MPLVPAPSNEAPSLEEGERADEKPGKAEGDEPCSLVGVAPLPKALILLIFRYHDVSRIVWTWRRCLVF